MTYERKKELYNFAIKNADKSIDKADEQQKILDSTLLKFSAGAFALSFSIINSFIPLSTSHFKIILLLSWSFFTLAIIIGLLSFIFAVKKYTYDYDFELERYEDLINENDSPIYNSNYFKLCAYFNNFMLICFCLGMICLLLFVFINL